MYSNYKTKGKENGVKENELDKRREEERGNSGHKKLLN